MHSPPLLYIYPDMSCPPFIKLHTFTHVKINSKKILCPHHFSV